MTDKPKLADYDEPKTTKIIDKPDDDKQLTTKIIDIPVLNHKPTVFEHKKTVFIDKSKFVDKPTFNRGDKKKEKRVKC